MKRLRLTILIILSAGVANAQSILDMQLNIDARSQRLDKTLESLSRHGNFYFSYNSSLLKRDSIVTLSAQGKTIRQILDLLFKGNIEYKENGNYIILRPAAKKASEIRASPEGKRYVVSGTIVDEYTGESIGQASVYDRSGLIATLTNEDGSFTVRFRKKPGPATLTVSKEFYEDTTISIEPGANQRITIIISPLSMDRKMVTISPDGYLPTDSIRVVLDGEPVLMRKDPIRVEMSGWGRLLLSSKLRIQSINLRKYFIQEPFQLSFLPAVGTQGPLSPQIINKVSINMVGGYTAGLNGVELGGIFNIDKRNVKGVQAAGMINVVGGTVGGVQLAGIHNTALDSMKGLQVAGISNTARVLRGTQISGIVNIARYVKGTQIGVINLADSLDGVAVGVLSLSRNGMKELVLFSDEITPMNISFRSGNEKLYSIFLAGYDPFGDRRTWRYGWGIGHRLRFSKTFALDPEITSESVLWREGSKYRQSDDIYKFNLDLHARLSRHFAITGGPSLTFYNADSTNRSADHRTLPVPGNYGSWKISDSMTGWIGWRLGLTLKL